MNKRDKIGNVFTIQLSDSERGFGQIIGLPNVSSLLIILFDTKQQINSIVSLDEICSSSIIMLGCTYDAKLYHGDWKTIGNYKTNVASVILPYYKLGSSSDNMFLVNYKGQKLKTITREESDKLTYQTFVAPIRFENALKAYYGFQSWLVDDYDNLLYKNTILSNEAF